MTILDELSSSLGDRTNASNLRVVPRVLADPSLLRELAGGLRGRDGRLAADCAEIFTQIAQRTPTEVAPYAEILIAQLGHKTTRVRWESMHALALVGPLVPEKIAPLLSKLDELMSHDTSVIVRDYAVTALANHAGTSPHAARAALPLLEKALLVWEGKHAARALDGLRRVAAVEPSVAAELRRVGESYLQDRRGVVKKAAMALVKAL